MYRRRDRRDRLGIVVRGRRDNMHLVAVGDELLGEARNVFGDAARIREVVRRDEGELHRRPLLTRAALRASASGKRSIAPDGWRYGTPAVWRWPELGATHQPSDRLSFQPAAAARTARRSVRRGAGWQSQSGSAPQSAPPM